jgi:RNA polymerase sigma factor (sigma-70 family)
VSSTGVGDLLRDVAPQVLGALVRRYGDFESCEDATQEALLRAATRWPADGVPANPRAWLVTVGSRILVDAWRSDVARRDRERLFATPESEALAHVPDRDDSLAMLFACCQPGLSEPSQVALTLRAIGGLTTAQIAAAFLVPEATMAQRISRAKRSIKDSGLTLDTPADPARLAAVLHVLYLIFNEGYTTSSGAYLTAPSLTGESIRLARWLHRLLPDDPEVTGLLALMLLTDARRPARTSDSGALVPLAEQDRGRWDSALIAEGVALVSEALPRRRVGPYQLQAAIAAVHDEAPDVASTDWSQILGLYDLLVRVEPGPMVRLNRAVAVGMVYGPAAGLAELSTLEDDTNLTGHHRLFATRAHLRALAGDKAGAAADFQAAAARTTSLPERRYLTAKAHDVG